VGETEQTYETKPEERNILIGKAEAVGIVERIIEHGYPRKLKKKPECPNSPKVSTGRDRWSGKAPTAPTHLQVKRNGHGKAGIEKGRKERKKKVQERHHHRKTCIT